MDEAPTGEAATGERAQFLTVEELAAALSIGRTLAYRLVKLGLATNGGEGIFAVRLGAVIRVPHSAIERLAEASAGAGE